MELNAIELIRSDILNFVDPGKDLLIDEREAYWIQNKKDMHIKFIRGETFYPDILYNEIKYSYKEFLGSEHMADIMSLAEAIQISTINQGEIFIDSFAYRENDNTDIIKMKGVELINSLSSENLPYQKTRLMFLRGEAGAGKTHLLRHLTVATAKEYLSGNIKYLYFYIDAQSKSLARLDDVIAALILDLKAKFHYRILSSLTRLGLIVPIIDGFDELIGSGGYGEAFESLTRFISRLNSEGTIVASARSTFYEYKGIREKVSRYEKISEIDYELVELKIAPWEEGQVIEYIEKSEKVDSGNAKLFYEKIRSTLSRELDFIKIPFFLVTIIEMLRTESTFSGKRIISSIVDYFIKRENSKLVNKSGAPLISDEGHREFLDFIAEEMWLQETNDLDESSIKTAAELVAEQYISEPKEREIFVEKSLTYAFFGISEENRRKTIFAHEYYKAYFTAMFFVRYIKNNKDISRLFIKNSISEVLATEFGWAVVEEDLDVNEVIRLISNRELPAIAQALNKENAGTLVGGILHCKGVEYSNLEVSSCDFAKVLFNNLLIKDSKISKCIFSDCSFSNTKFINVIINSVTFTRMIVNQDTTNLGGIELEIGSSLNGVVLIDKTNKEIYNPDLIRTICKKIGIKINDGRQDEKCIEISPKIIARIEVLHKYLKIAQRLYYLSEEDIQKTGLRQNKNWVEVEKILLRNNIIENIQISRKGPSGYVKKLKYLPEMVLLSESRNSDKVDLINFWNDIYTL